MKKRSYTLLTYALAILLGVALFLTSERVQRAERLYNDIQEKLAMEYESHHILKTEWTYLNRPDRLEDLTATHLNLTLLKPETTLTSTISLPVFLNISSDKSKTKDLAETPVIQALTNPAPAVQTLNSPTIPAASSVALHNLPATLNMIETSAKTTGAAIPIPNTNAKTIKVSMKPKLDSPKKQTSAKSNRNVLNRNRSTTAVTFYQYMNRPSSPYYDVRGK